MPGPLPNVLLDKKYELIRVIGHGQYGTAHKARSKVDGQIVCLKRVALNKRDDHKGALQEAQLLSSLDHPNIIAYKESFLDSEGALCLVTTYCEDGDLFTKIRNCKAAGTYFSETEVMDTIIQVASALQYVHSRKILHRDLKTQNIFLKSNGIVMLGDFGICKVLEKTDSFATTVTGTPYYMAPEVCTNQPYTFKSDIWSLGCVLYELCTLTHAFAADSLLSLVYQIVRGSYPPVSSELFSQDMISLVKQLLTSDATQRPSLQQIVALPYIQSHMQRFSSEERRRILQKQSSSSRGFQQLTIDLPLHPFSGGGSPAGDTSPAGLTPKQRLEWKKQGERRRRELELQLASLNASKDRNEVAKRRQQQLASSSLHGILPAAQHAPRQHAQQQAVIDSLKRQQQLQHQQGQQQLTQSGQQMQKKQQQQSLLLQHELQQSVSLQQRHSPQAHSPVQLKHGNPAIHVTAAPAVGLHGTGSLAAMQLGSHSAGSSPSNRPASCALWAKSAYQEYEDRAVGLSTCKAGEGFSIYDEDEDAVNLGTMPAAYNHSIPAADAHQSALFEQHLAAGHTAAWGTGQQGHHPSAARRHKTSGRPATAAPSYQDPFELSMDSDSVLLGTKTSQQQRPGTAPICIHVDERHSTFKQQHHQQHSRAVAVPHVPAGTDSSKGSSTPSSPVEHIPVEVAQTATPITAAAIVGIAQKTASEALGALAAAADRAAAGPNVFKFGLTTIERRAYSSSDSGATAAATAATEATAATKGTGSNSGLMWPSASGSGAAVDRTGSRSSVSSDTFTRHSLLGVGRGGVVRFGARDGAPDAGAFDFVLDGIGADSTDLENEHIFAGVPQQQQHPASGDKQQSGQQSMQEQPAVQAVHRYQQESSSTRQQQHATPRSVGNGGEAHRTEDEEYADEAFEEYDAEHDVDDSTSGLRDEVQQRLRIMQSLADLSRYFPSVSVHSEDAAQMSASQQQVPSQPNSTAGGSSKLSGTPRPTGQGSTAVSIAGRATRLEMEGAGLKHPSLASCKDALGSDFKVVYNYLVQVHTGAADGSASAVCGDEVKECLQGMVGCNKAKQEACFSLEQIVFRAVLTGSQR